MKKLNLGCGTDYKEGWINVDVRKNIRTDKRFDLDILPYPFKENEFDEVLLSHVLEHLKNPVEILKEIIRISKNDAKVLIIVPHASSYANLSDIQHKAKFTESSFTKEHLKEYELEQLKLENMKFIFKNNKWKKFIPFKRFLKIFFNGIYDDILFEFCIQK